MRGATSIVIFTGIRNAEFNVSVLEKGLLPFLHQKFPDGQHRFMEDNDPKHVHAMLKHILKSMASTGGAHLPSLPTSSPLRIFGTN